MACLSPVDLKDIDPKFLSMSDRMALLNLKSKSASAEGEVKLEHSDVWTHKIEHVIYKNGVEVLRKEQEDEKIEKDISGDPEGKSYPMGDEELRFPHHFVQHKLVLDYGDDAAPQKPVAPKPIIETCKYWGMTLGDIIAEHEVVRTEWADSQWCTDLIKMIQSMDDSSKVPITNIVFLDNGSFQKRIQMGREIDHLQLAILETIKKHLKDSDKIKCIVQGSKLTDLDKKFLSLHGFEAVNDPAGFAAINSGSLVYMVHSPPLTKAVIGQGVRPAAMLSDTVTEAQKYAFHIVGGYEQRPFPKGTTVEKEFELFMSSVNFYWKTNAVVEAPASA